MHEQGARNDLALSPVQGLVQVQGQVHGLVQDQVQLWVLDLVLFQFQVHAQL